MTPFPFFPVFLFLSPFLFFFSLTPLSVSSLATCRGSILSLDPFPSSFQSIAISPTAKILATNYHRPNEAVYFIDISVNPYYAGVVPPSSKSGLLYTHKSANLCSTQSVTMADKSIVQTAYLPSFAKSIAISAAQVGPNSFVSFATLGSPNRDQQGTTILLPTGNQTTLYYSAIDLISYIGSAKVNVSRIFSTVTPNLGLVMAIGPQGEWLASYENSQRILLFNPVINRVRPQWNNAQVGVEGTGFATDALGYDNDIAFDLPDGFYLDSMDLKAGYLVVTGVAYVQTGGFCAPAFMIYFQTAPTSPWNQLTSSPVFLPPNTNGVANPLVHSNRLPCDSTGEPANAISVDVDADGELLAFGVPLLQCAYVTTLPISTLSASSFSWSSTCAGVTAVNATGFGQSVRFLKDTGQTLELMVGSQYAMGIFSLPLQSDFSMSLVFKVPNRLMKNTNADLLRTFRQSHAYDTLLISVQDSAYLSPSFPITANTTSTIDTELYIAPAVVPGYRYTYNSRGVDKCVRGRYKDDTSFYPCVYCPAGRFASIDGATECEKCEEESYCPTGSVNQYLFEDLQREEKERPEFEPDEFKEVFEALLIVAIFTFKTPIMPIFITVISLTIFMAFLSGYLKRKSTLAKCARFYFNFLEYVHERMHADIEHAESEGKKYHEEMLGHHEKKHAGGGHAGGHMDGTHTPNGHGGGHGGEHGEEEFSPTRPHPQFPSKTPETHTPASHTPATHTPADSPRHGGRVMAPVMSPPAQTSVQVHTAFNRHHDEHLIDGHQPTSSSHNTPEHKSLGEGGLHIPQIGLHRRSSVIRVDDDPIDDNNPVFWSPLQIRVDAISLAGAFEGFASLVFGIFAFGALGYSVHYLTSYNPDSLAESGDQNIFRNVESQFTGTKNYEFSTSLKALRSTGFTMEFELIGLAASENAAKPSCSTSRLITAGSFHFPGCLIAGSTDSCVANFDVGHSEHDPDTCVVSFTTPAGTTLLDSSSVYFRISSSFSFQALRFSYSYPAVPSIAYDPNIIGGDVGSVVPNEFSELMYYGTPKVDGYLGSLIRRSWTMSAVDYKYQDPSGWAADFINEWRTDVSSTLPQQFPIQSYFDFAYTDPSDGIQIQIDITQNTFMEIDVAQRLVGASQLLLTLVLGLIAIHHMVEAFEGVVSACVSHYYLTHLKVKVQAKMLLHEQAKKRKRHHKHNAKHHLETHSGEGSVQQHYTRANTTEVVIPASARGSAKLQINPLNTVDAVVVPLETSSHV